MGTLRLPLTSVAAVIALAGCVDKSPPPPPVDPALVAGNLLPVAPADLTNRVGAAFGGGVVYLGNTVETPHPGPLVPGDKLTVVHYWQVNQPPPKGYRVFSHLVGDQGDFSNVDVTDMRKGHPPDTWSAGEIIRDRQTFILRKDWRSKQARLSVGLYKKGSPKVTDRLAVTGAPANDGAVSVVVFDIDVSKVPPPPGTVVLPKATGAITIDGKADEPSWQTAASTSDFQTAEGGPDPKGATAAKLTWDDQNLYVFASVTDTDVASPYTQTDEPIWKADVVEVFIDADKSGKGYVELQVSPANVQFDTWYPIGRPNDDKSFDAHMTSAVNIRGTLNGGADDDQGWDVEIAIPLAAVKGLDAAMAVRLPPQPGDTWRLNLVRVDYPKGSTPAAAAWNRIRYSDFHSIDRLLTVQFADASGSTVAPPVVLPGTPVEPGAVTPGAPAGAVTPGAPAGAVTPGAPAAPTTIPARPAPGAPSTPTGATLLTPAKPKVPAADPGAASRVPRPPTPAPAAPSTP